VGAAGAAVTGLTDFQDIDPPASRIGMVHGLLNITAASLFLTSLIQRRANARSAGRRFALMGFLVGVSAAFLGGALVYDQGIGVDHTLGQSFPEDFTSVLSESALPEGELKRIEYDGVPILLVKRGNQILAVAETCSHLGGPLSEGKLIGNGVQCPWHASQFSLEDGRVLDGPAVHPLPCLEVRVNNGEIEVRTRKAKQNSAGTSGATVPRPEAA
jgi:nitrite reductase/ring-hydroxylating ferredoxin subunit